MVAVSPTDWRTYPRPGRPSPQREPVSPGPQSRLAAFLGMGTDKRRPGVAGWLIPRTIVGLAAWSLVLVSLIGVFVAFGFAAQQARIAEKEQARLGQAKTEQSELDAVPPAAVATPSPAPADPITILIGSSGRSVVAVEDFDDQGGVTAGTGFVLQATPNDLWVVTSYSIVRAARAEGRPIKIRFPNFSRLDGDVRTVDETRDLALVLVSGERLPGINRFAPPVTAAGTKAFALGVNATSGRVVGQEVTISQVLADGLLLEAPGIAAGAGGPILDADGNLIGVLPVTYKPKGQEPGLWAVPAQMLCRRVVVCPAAVKETPSPSASPRANPSPSP